ncbi:hypothetical protein pb186bvf_007701 [Paramecium bursaria]
MKRIFEMRFLKNYRIKSQVIIYQIVCLGFIIILQLIMYGGAFFYLILPIHLRNYEIIQQQQTSRSGNNFLYLIQRYYFNSLMLDYNNIQSSEQLFQFSQKEKIQYYDLIKNCNSLTKSEQCYTLLDYSYLGVELLFQMIPLFHVDNVYSQYFVSQPDIGFYSEYNKTENISDPQNWYCQLDSDLQILELILMITFFLLIQDNIYLGKHLSLQKYDVINSLRTLNSSNMKIQLLSPDGQIIQSSQQQNEIIYIQNTTQTGFNEKTLQIILQYNQNQSDTSLKQCESLKLFNNQLCLINNKSEKYIVYSKPIVQNNLFMLFTLKSSDFDAYLQIYTNAFWEELLFQLSINSVCYGIVIFICLFSSLILVSTLNKSINNLQQFASNYIKCPNYHFKNQLINIFIFKNQSKSNCIHELNRAFQRLIIMDYKNSKNNKQKILFTNCNQFFKDKDKSDIYRIDYYNDIIFDNLFLFWSLCLNNQQYIFNGYFYKFLSLNPYIFYKYI